MAGPSSRNLAADFNREGSEEREEQVPIVETPGVARGQQGMPYMPMAQLLNQMIRNAQVANAGVPHQQRGIAASRQEEGESTTMPSTNISRGRAPSRILIESDSEERGDEEQLEIRKAIELRRLKRKVQRLEEQLLEREAPVERSHKSTRSSQAEGVQSSVRERVAHSRGGADYYGDRKTEPYIPLHTGGRQAIAKRDNPFSNDILQDPLPSHFKPVNYEYDGTTDPEEHISRFENIALLHQYSEGVKCRVFATTLVGLAQQWFKQLVPQSIFSFDDFYELFMGQFASARRSAKSSLLLTTIKQGVRETLREYVSRFNIIALETTGIDARIKIEKAALALMTTARKLRPYFLSHKIVVRTTFPFLQILGRPDTSGRMVKWAVELGEYDIEFQARTAVKAQALVEFIAETTRTAEGEAWKAWVDGSVTKEKSGVGVLIEKPDGAKLQFAIQFKCKLSNNEAEYEAMVRAMQILSILGAEEAVINTDSQLVAQQVLGNYEVKEERMRQYLDRVKDLTTQFRKFTVMQIPREENEGADRLAKLASAEAPPYPGEITLLEAEGRSTAAEVYTVEETSDWRAEIVHYLKTGEGKLAPSRLAAKYAKYFFLGDQLYRRGFNNPHLRCLSREEGDHILKEIHAGCCGNHSGKRDLVRKVIRAGYYWPGVMEAAKKVVQTCDSCQRHAPLIHVPGEEMGAMYASCPFDKWGIDIVGKFPTAPGGKVFLIVAVDYFSKWVEAEAVTKIDDATIQRFLWKNICCRYGAPRILISDNGTQFTSVRIQEWCADMGIQQRFVSVAHPQANGQVEVTNRTISEGIKKRLEGSKGKWAEELDAVLWAYRTSPRTATGEAPFTLVYGANAVIPAEIVMETYRIREYNEKMNGEARREELDLVDIRREQAHVQEEKYKSQIRAAYNKHVKIRRLDKGDLVLKRVDAVRPVTKLEPNWEGPFIITEVVGGGAYHLSDMEGRPLTRPWNINTLKKYYV